MDPWLILLDTIDFILVSILLVSQKDKQTFIIKSSEDMWTIERVGHIRKML